MAKKKNNEETFPSRKKNFGFEYKFTPDELAEKASQLAQACQELNALDDDRKAAASAFKSKMDGKEAEVNVLSRSVSTGKEWVTKTCDCIYYHNEGVKKYFFENKQVGEEQMLEGDYQLEAQL